MTSNGYSTTAVEIVDIEPRLAAVVRRRVAMSDMADAQRGARRILEATLEESGVTAAGPKLTLWRMPENGSIDYAPGVFVAAPLTGPDDVSVTTLPGGRAAHLRLDGSYAGLPDAWSRLFKGCEGHKLSGLNWEIYTSDGPDGARTDLYAHLA